MQKLFIETTGFTREVTACLDDQAYAAFQKQLMDDPDRGEVMPGCGGLRKVRLADPRRRKGKRGGFRVIYLHVPEAGWVLLLDMYEKGEKEDLAPAEKKALKKLAEQFKAEAIRAAARQGRRNRHE
jgi:mRNA-degrading endonuclease RelE of RelBE toxin-antitoxin system